MNSKAIEAVVEWWADKLRSCKHSGLSDEERQDSRNREYELAEMLMTIAKPKVTDEQVAKFKAALRSTLETGTVCWLDVDYGPNLPLFNALKFAEIDPGMGTLPIKTSMWIEDDKVLVRYGYGAEKQQIWRAGA